MGHFRSLDLFAGFMKTNLKGLYISQRYGKISKKSFVKYIKTFTKIIMTIHKCIHFVKRHLKIMFIRIFIDLAYIFFSWTNKLCLQIILITKHASKKLL